MTWREEGLGWVLECGGHSDNTHFLVCIIDTKDKRAASLGFRLSFGPTPAPTGKTRG